MCMSTFAARARTAAARDHRAHGPLSLSAKKIKLSPLGHYDRTTTHPPQRRKQEQKGMDSRGIEPRTTPMLREYYTTKPRAPWNDLCLLYGISACWCQFVYTILFLDWAGFSGELRRPYSQVFMEPCSNLFFFAFELWKYGIPLLPE